MLCVGKQPLVGRSTGSPTLKEAARETTYAHMTCIDSNAKQFILKNSGVQLVLEKADFV
jgi:hypothetical protein